MTANTHTGERLDVAIYAIDALIGRYVSALDWQDWVGWLGTFGDECEYSVTSQQNAENNLPLCYMIDDCRERLVDRVKFITEVWSSTIEPYRTRHLVQRLSIDPLEGGEFSVTSNFSVMFTHNNNPSEVLATGFYRDVVKVVDGTALFSKKSVFIDGTPARYLAYPL